MRTILQPACAWTRVGARSAVPHGEPLALFHVEDGTMQVKVGPGTPWATPAERAAGRATVRAQKLPAPPYAVTEDLTLVEGNFSQANPHTEVFTLAPGVTLVLEDCQGFNATIPDGAVVRGGNWQHGVRVVASDGTECTIACECEKCSIVTPTVQALIDAGDRSCRLPDGRWDHSTLKEKFREERKSQAKKDAAIAARRALNDAACARLGVTLDAGKRAKIGRA